MRKTNWLGMWLAALALSAAGAWSPAARQSSTASPPRSNAAEEKAPTHADLLRGTYGPERANNDLLYYHLDVRVDPEKKFISGKNTIRFKMLSDSSRIQLDLHEALKVEKILLGSTEVKYARDSGA